MTLYRVEVRSPINGKWYGVYAATAFGNWRYFPDRSVPYFPMSCMYYSLPGKVRRENLRSKFWFKADSFDKQAWYQFQLDCEESNLECRLLTRKLSERGKILEDDAQAAYWYCRRTGRVSNGPKVDTSDVSNYF